MSTALAPLPAHPRDAEVYKPSFVLFDDELTLSIREMRELLRCRKCGRDQWDVESGITEDNARPCAHGCCTVFACLGCGHYNSGFGAAGCPCDDGI